MTVALCIDWPLDSKSNKAFASSCSIVLMTSFFPMMGSCSISRKYRYRWPISKHCDQLDTSQFNHKTIHIKKFQLLLHKIKSNLNYLVKFTLTSMEAWPHLLITGGWMCSSPPQAMFMPNCQRGSKQDVDLAVEVVRCRPIMGPDFTGR